MHQATASNFLNKNMPIRIAVTFNVAENNPQIKRFLVSFAAWYMEPDVDSIICIPTDNDSIWNTAMEGYHCSPKISRIISFAQNHNNTERGNPIKAK